METLQEYVRRVMIEKRLSSYDVQKASMLTMPDGSMDSISDSTVQNIVNGKSRGINSTSIPALARGLGEDPRKVAEVAMGLEPSNESDPLMLKARELVRLAYIRGDEVYVSRSLDGFIMVLKDEISRGLKTEKAQKDKR